MRKTKLVVLGLVVLQGIAAADSGLSFGPVLEQSDVGVRGGLDSGLFVLAGEHYQSTTTARTRVELALRVPVPLGGRFRLDPQLGLFPVDYASSTTGQRVISMSASGTVGLTMRITGPLWLVLEPLRIEARFAQITVESPITTAPTLDKSTRWQVGSWVALRLGI